MKKLYTILAISMYMLVQVPLAHADIFPSIGEQKLKAVERETVSVDANTILSEVTQISEYLGVREGGLYDFGQHEFCNYAAATLITWEPYGISVDIGAVNADGVAETVDFNAGKYIPAQNVPLLNFLQYFYVGGGLAQRYINDDWKVSAVIDAQFKFTF